MSFLDSYEHEKLNDGNIRLKITPVENYPEISIYINPNGKYITIFDGGTTITALAMVYNFKSNQVIDKFIEICKTRKVSKKGNVLSLQCEECEFETRIEDFKQALNEICNI